MPMNAFANNGSGTLSWDRSPRPEVRSLEGCVGGISSCTGLGQSAGIIRPNPSGWDPFTLGSAAALVLSMPNRLPAIPRKTEEFYFLRTIKYTSPTDTQNPTSRASLMSVLIGRKL
jgi:hypothetical protein